MKINVKEILKPIVVLFLIAAVMAALLGGTNLLTRDRIEQLALKTELEAVAKVMEGETTVQTLTLDGKEYTYYKAEKDSKVQGYVFKTSANGYGGAVSVIVGFNTDGSITAAEITDVSNETPGLGQNAKKTSFYEQFAGKNATLSVVKSNPDSSEIKAVTGATITSSAVVSAINEARVLFNEVMKGETGNE